MDYFGGPSWGQFWEQIGPRRGQYGPKRDTKSFKDLKSCICKNLKKPPRLFGSRGLPREAPEAHEGSQEAPKELQNLKNKGIKKWTHKLSTFGPNLGPFWDPFWGAKMGSKIGPKLVPFLGLFWTTFYRF